MSSSLASSGESGKFSSRFGLWGGYFFSINTVIGSGFLALPYAFNSSGWLFGFILLTLMAFGSYYFSCELLEILSRIECIVRIEEQNTGRKIKRLTWTEIIFKPQGEEALLEHEDRPIITNRRFDVTAIISIVFGRNFGIFYMICLYLFLTGAQISYFSIFSASFAAQVPLWYAETCDIYVDTEFFGDCRQNYWFFWSIYLICMIYLTIKGLKEQLWLQSCLTIMRFVIISLILLTSLALIAGSKTIDSDQEKVAEMPELLHSSNALGCLPILIFAFMYQIQFPSIAESTRDKKRSLPTIIKMVSVTSGLLYCAIAMIVPVAIHNVKAQSSIEYRDYSAGYAQHDRPWWTYFIAYVVVLFPAFDVFSSFPLMGIGISDNLMGLIYGPNNPKLKDKTTILLYRIFTVIVPAIISFFAFDLAIILDWVGLVGMILVPITFPLLHIATREMLRVKSRFNAPFYSRVRFI